MKLQQALKKLARMAHWNYSQVSYDPANPATFSAAVDNALDQAGATTSPKPASR